MKIHELVVLSDLGPEINYLTLGPADRFNVGRGLAVEITVYDLDIPVFAEFQLLQAFGTGDFPVADHEYLKVFWAITRRLERPQSSLNFELIGIPPIPCNS